MAKNMVMHNVYINNTYSNFVKGLADFFRTDWFDRSNDVVVSTYDKGVEHFKKRKEEAGENYKPRYPFICIDPSLEFEPDDPIGYSLQNYPQFGAHISSQEYSPRLYEDDNMYIAPVLNRYRGDIEVIIWCSSVYDLIDTRMKTMQFFGGYNRPIVPRHIQGYFILPDELITFTYNNKYTGASYKLDWENNQSTEVVLVKNINQNKRVFPYVVDPYIKLVGISDGSGRYGASPSEIGEHRLLISLEYDVALPTHLILVGDALPAKPAIFCQMDIGIGYRYVYATSSSDNVIATPKEIMTTIKENNDSTSTYNLELIFKEEYNYTLTAADHQKIQNEDNSGITITIPDTTIDNVAKVRVYGKYGIMTRDLHWKFTSPNIIELIPFNLGMLEEDDIISIEIYEIDN